MLNPRKVAPALWALLGIAIVTALCVSGCATIGQFPPGGRVCRPDTAASEDCNCEVFVVPSGWAHRDCPPSPPPTPQPTPTPCQFPCPPGTHATVDGDACRDQRTDGKALWLDECLPDPQPTPSATPTPPQPTPVPSPTPCAPHVEPFRCPPGTANECWACADRIAWDVERGNWTPLPGTGLLYNDPNGNPQRREYLDRACNLVRRDGGIIRTAEQQFGRACVDGNAICPPSMVVPCPSPTPGPEPTPTPGSTPTPGATPAACPPIGGLGGQVHQFVNAQHQTVPYHREGDGGRIYVADGPVVGGDVLFDSTVYFGCGAPRCACDGDHDGCGGRVCEDPRGQSWRVLSGAHGECSTWNNGQEGDGAPRGYGYRCRVTAPTDLVVEACTGEPWIDGLGKPVPGRACMTVTARVRQ